MRLRPLFSTGPFHEHPSRRKFFQQGHFYFNCRCLHQQRDRQHHPALPLRAHKYSFSTYERTRAHADSISLRQIRMRLDSSRTGGHIAERLDFMVRNRRSDTSAAYEAENSSGREDVEPTLKIHSYEDIARK